MTASERLEPREGLEARLVERLEADGWSSGDHLDVATVLDAIEAEGFAVVPDEWVPRSECKGAAKGGDLS